MAYALVHSRITRATPTRTDLAVYDPAVYWKERYRTGGDSGPGSEGRLAEFKAEIINEFAAKEKVESVIEFGCGDGRQLKLSRYQKYLGIDISEIVLEKCRMIFADQSEYRFQSLEEYIDETADLTLSLDVIAYLGDDDMFSTYMNKLFNAATRYVIIYASNSDSPPALSVPHLRNREFTLWVAANKPDWHLIRHIPNRYPSKGKAPETSTSDFFIFKKSN